MIELKFEEQLKTKLKLTQPEKITRNVTPNSTGRKFLIRDRNSVFYPPLERLQNSLGFWYSRLPRFRLEVGLKSKFVQTVRSVQN
jgi:hypothetical protein